jgi:hypothetical protein
MVVEIPCYYDSSPILTLSPPVASPSMDHLGMLWLYQIMGKFITNHILYNDIMGFVCIYIYILLNIYGKKIEYHVYAIQITWVYVYELSMEYHGGW